MDGYNYYLETRQTEQKQKKPAFSLEAIFVCVLVLFLVFLLAFL